MLVFNQSGACIKEIGGSAIVEDGYVGVPRPPALAGAPMRFLTIVEGVVTQRAEMPEETMARDSAAYQNALIGGVTKVLLNHENRIRALEAKPAITINQFRAAVKTILGL